MFLIVLWFLFLFGNICSSIWLCQVFAVALLVVRADCKSQHMGSSSLTRDLTWAPCMRTRSPGQWTAELLVFMVFQYKRLFLNGFMNSDPLLWFWRYCCSYSNCLCYLLFFVWFSQNTLLTFFYGVAPLVISLRGFTHTNPLEGSLTWQVVYVQREGWKPWQWLVFCQVLGM